MILKQSFFLKLILSGFTIMLSEQKPTVAIIDFDFYGIGKDQVNMLSD